MTPEQMQQLQGAMREEEETPKRPGFFSTLGSLVQAAALPYTTAWGGTLGLAEGLGKQERAPLSRAGQRAWETALSQSFQPGTAERFGYQRYAKELGMDVPGPLATTIDIMADLLMGGGIPKKAPGISTAFKGKAVTPGPTGFAMTPGGAKPTFTGAPIPAGRIGPRPKPIQETVELGELMPELAKTITEMERRIAQKAFPAAQPEKATKLLQEVPRPGLYPKSFKMKKERGVPSEVYPGQYYKSTEDKIADALEELQDLQRYLEVSKGTF